MKSSATGRKSPASKASAKPSSKANGAKRRRKSAAPDPSVDVQPTAEDLNKTEQVEVLESEHDTPTAQAGGFPFSSKQLQYLLACREAALEGRAVSDSAISEATGISRTTIWTWHHDPAFVAWFTSEVKAGSDIEFELAVARQTRLAIKGSVRSFEAVARLRSLGLKGGGFTDPGDTLVDNSISNYSVILLSPRPPALPAGGGA